MKYVFKTFNELTPDDIRQYLDLYNTTFERDLSETEFRYKFTQQMGPNSYFVFIVDDKAGIVGSLGAIEVDYTFRGEQLKFGLEVDAMIDPAYRRDVLAMRRQHDVLFKELNRRGFGWVFTKPNNNSYLYLKTLLGFSDIGQLWAYAFPIRPFRALHPWLSFLDPLWLTPVTFLAWLANPRNFQEASLDTLEPENPELIANAARARLRRGDNNAEVRSLLSKLVMIDTRPEWVEWARRKLVLLPLINPATMPTEDHVQLENAGRS